VSAGVPPDDRALERWFSLEMARLRDGLVLSPRPIGEAALEARPVAPTRSGGEHLFDRAVLGAACARLSPLERRQVRIPVTFFVEADVPDDAYVSEGGPVTFLRALGEIAPDAAPREGRLWVGRARALAISGRHPSLFQFVFL
jgi:uncharacterized protein (UPF0216 family)